MKYRIDVRYCWYENKSMLVEMYFINNIPFTFDEVPKELYEDQDVIELANNSNPYTTDDLYRYSFYLIEEECHPLLYELDLENPELLPTD